MLIQLTHPDENFELWIESTEIVALERYRRPKTILIQLEERPDVTAIVLKCGKTLSCKELPIEIMEKIKE